VDNNLTTCYKYDNVGRLTEEILTTDDTCTVDAAKITLTETIYNDANRKIEVKKDLLGFGSGELQTKTHYDKLGRVYLAQKSDGAELTSDADGIKVSTCDVYQGGGRRVATTTPYRSLSDPTLESTLTQYDQSGRVTAVTKFAGGIDASCLPTGSLTGITTTAYDADWTTVTLGTGTGQKVKKQRRDSLGRMIGVVEDPSGLIYTTGYSYDPLDNLTQVGQGSQTRSFVYSSLNRLQSASNPESGTTNYTYYESGDMWTRRDARNHNHHVL